MTKIFLLLLVAFGLTMAHAQVVPKSKPENNAELIDTTPAVVRRIVKVKDSVFVYDRESLKTRVAAKDWPNTPLAKKIAGESNLNNEAPAANAKLKNNETMGPALRRIVQVKDSVFNYEGESLVKRVPAKEWPAAEKSNSQPEYTITVKKNDSVYVFRNGTLLNKRADKSKTSNQSARAAANDVAIPVLLQHK